MGRVRPRWLAQSEVNKVLPFCELKHKIHLKIIIYYYYHIKKLCFLILFSMTICGCSCTLELIGNRVILASKLGNVIAGKQCALQFIWKQILLDNIS